MSTFQTRAACRRLVASLETAKSRTVAACQMSRTASWRHGECARRRVSKQSAVSAAPVRRPAPTPPRERRGGRLTQREQSMDSSLRSVRHILQPHTLLRLLLKQWVNNGAVQVNRSVNTNGIELSELKWQLCKQVNCIWGKYQSEARIFQLQKFKLLVNTY